MGSAVRDRGGRTLECSRRRSWAKVVLAAVTCVLGCRDTPRAEVWDARVARRAPAARAFDAAAKVARSDQPRALPAPPRLSPADATAALARLAGTWVSDTGLESITWRIDSSGAVREVVHQRGRASRKTKPLRSRTFTITVERTGEFIARDTTGTRRYRYALRKRRLYASDRYGVFPLPSSKRFAVAADGVAIQYDRGTCTGTRIDGAPIDVRCKYVKSGPLEVFTAHYRLPNRPRPTTTLFHKVGTYIAHETMLSCCEFKRR